MAVGAKRMYGVASAGEHAGEYTRCRAKDPATCRYHVSGSHRLMTDAQFMVACEQLACENNNHRGAASLSKASTSDAGNNARVDNRGVALPPRPSPRTNEPRKRRTVQPTRPIDSRGTHMSVNAYSEPFKVKGKSDERIHLESGIDFGNLDNPGIQPDIIRNWSYPGMRFASSKRYDNRLALDYDYQASFVIHRPQYLDENTPVMIDIQRFKDRKGYIIEMEEPKPLRGGRVPESKVHARHPDGKTSIIMRPSPQSGRGVYTSSRLTRHILDDLHAKTVIHNGNRDPRVDSEIVSMQYDTRDMFSGRVVPAYGKPPKKPSLLHPFLRSKWRKAREWEEQTTTHGMAYQYPNDPTGRHATGILN